MEDLKGRAGVERTAREGNGSERGRTFLLSSASSLVTNGSSSRASIMDSNWSREIKTFAPIRSDHDTVVATQDITLISEISVDRCMKVRAMHMARPGARRGFDRGTRTVRAYCMWTHLGEANLDGLRHGI